MKTLLALFLFTISIFSLACPESAQLKNYNACVKIQWNYGPYINQYNEILVTLDAIDPTRPIQNDEIKIFPWMIMNHHEHGSRPVIQTKLRENEYKVEKIYFMGGMQGTWQIRVQHLNAGKLIEEVRHNVLFQ